jgi:hypothetical protein
MRNGCSEFRDRCAEFTHFVTKTHDKLERITRTLHEPSVSPAVRSG